MKQSPVTRAAVPHAGETTGANEWRCLSKRWPTVHKTPSKRLCALGWLELVGNGSSGGDQQRRWLAALWWLHAATGRVEEEKETLSGPGL
ncbi:hypothetical protein Droror1_Dr00020402 [Drosera rotundifolia]